jgi:hypothetical protein
MANKWMAHVKKTMKKMSGQKKSMGKGWFKHVLKSAKSSYHKKGGGESDLPEDPENSVKGAMGGRRHKTHKKRRHH